MKPKVKKLAPVTFETALGWLRRGKSVRRREWHKLSLIFRLGAEVFVRLPGQAPTTWRPYSHDFLATDWEKV